MKKYLGIFSAVFALTAISFSCQKAEITDPNSPGTEQTYNKVDVVLTATIESRLDTKVTLAFPKLSWEDQDQIAVFDGKNTAPNVFTYQAPVVEDETTEETNPEDVTPAAVAVKSSVVRPSFSGSIVESAEELYAVYPYNANATLADGKITTTIPHEQVVPEGGNVDKSALLCVAKTTSDALAFKNVLGLVKVTVPGDMKIARITLRGKDNETLAGTGTIEVTDTPKFDATEAATSITLTYADNGVFPAGEYYLAVAPVEFKNGFTISFTKVDAKTALKEATKSNTVARNGGLDTKNLLTTLSWVYEIYNKTDLLNWGANWGRYDHVILMEDIDMEEELWTPVGDGDNWFCGVFDGNEKKIYNFNVNTDGYAGFIGHLAGSGCVKNLTIGSKDGTNHDGKSAIIHTPSKDEYGWNYVGAIAKAGDHAVVEGVTNFAKVVIPESGFKVKACMGGVVGFHAGSGEINTCVNRAELNFLAADGPAVSNVIGGIVSKLDGVTKVSNCDNYGKITNKNAKVFYIGGIVGNTRSSNYKNDKPSTIQTCKNEGAIEILAASADSCGIGGICGMLQNANISTCTNTGKITLSTTSSDGICIGGVAGMRRNQYDTSISGCVNGTENMTESLFVYNATAGQVRLGGVLGHCHNSSGKLELVGCYNHSPINITHAGLRQVGGLCSAVAKGVELSVDDCHNTGDITLGDVASNHSSAKQFGGLFGYLVSASGKTFEIKNSTNTGDVETSVSAGGETQVAGITGYLGAYVSLSKCVNEGNISSKNSAFKPRVGGIAGVADATGTKILSCENKGGVTNSSANDNLYIGGIVAYAKNITIGVAEGELKGCVNAGEVKVTAAGGESKIGGIAGQAENVTIEKSYNQNKVSFTADKLPRLGGIVGNIIKDVTIRGCHNQNDGVIDCLQVGGTACVGGVAGRIGGGSTTSQNIIIEDSSNSGAVTVKSTKNSILVGGIVAVIEHGNTTGTQNRIERCFNNGGITASSTSTGSNQYVRAGGIVGQCSNITNTVISDCENKEGGIVAITNTTTPSGTHAAGIVGYTRVCVGLSNNTNRAQISANGSNSSVYVGGIWAYDDTMASGHTVKDITGNVNYGEISGTCGSGKTLSVGGLFGIVRKVAAANLKSDNINYGNVTCAGGALAGSSSITWSGMVGTSVIVNGEEGAETTPAAAWLCPSGNVTGSYVTE